MKILILPLTLLLVNTARGANYPRLDEPCTTDADCFEDYEVCKGITSKLDEVDPSLRHRYLKDIDSGTCEHKDVWPMTTMEWVGNFVTIIVLLVSNCGGLGGGGAFIPVAMIFYGFNAKQAIGLSNASICVASIIRYIVNFKKSHPLKNGKGVLVDYNVASLMLPMIVVGATTGVMINKILPPIIVAIIFTILLVFFNITTLRKLLKIQADERMKFGPVCGNKIDK